MVFNSLAFAPFFVICLAFYYGGSSWRYRKAILLVASYVFYGFFHAPYVLILIASTLIDFFLAKKMQLTQGRKRKALLGISLLTNLGMLAYFKYSAFVLANFTDLIAQFGVRYEPVDWGLVLPVGISYFTFQTLSYSIDVYRGRLEPTDSLLDFGFFVAFFPQLVAGPIVRAAYFMPQTQESQRGLFNLTQFGWGLHLLLFGLFGKIVLADRLLAPIVDEVFFEAQHAGFQLAWVGTIAFSGQIFFDFAGYSMAAIGVAMCFGFALPDNFRFPYAATGFSDFWRRWHISLSTWLRDYLYISLGGNRAGSSRTYFNLMATMVLGGLWHGAAWTFVVWGFLHGLYLVLERICMPFLDRLPILGGRFGAFLGILVTYILVCYAWVFFRAESLADALSLVENMCSPAWGEQMPENTLLMLGVMTIVLAYQQRYRDRSVEGSWMSLPKSLRLLLLSSAIFLIVTTQGEQRAFIYFQF